MADPFDLDTEDLDDVIENEQDDDTSEIEGAADEAEDGSDLKAEVEALKRQQAEAQQAQLRAQEAALEAKRQAELDAKEHELIKKRWEALENDDKEEFNKFDKELTDVRLERRISRTVSRHDRKTEDQEIAQEAQAWIALNPEFYSDEEFRDRVLQINEELIQEYRADDPRLYKELSRRLEKENLKQKPKPTASADPPKQKAGAVAGVNRGGGQPKKSGSKKLTRSDLQSMAKYGLDPNNQDHRRGWLRRNSPV